MGNSNSPYFSSKQPLWPRRQRSSHTHSGALGYADLSSLPFGIGFGAAEVDDKSVVVELKILDIQPDQFEPPERPRETGLHQRHLNHQIGKLGLTDEQEDEIVDFLNTLTAEYNSKAGKVEPV